MSYLNREICILTFEFNYNYGAVLQAYALSEKLKEFGYTPVILNRGWKDYINNRIKLKDIPGYLMGYFITLRHFYRFKRKYLRLSKPIRNREEELDFCSQFKTVIVGSDQIWNDEIFESMGCHYFAECFPISTKRIAYAVSFGKDSFRIPILYKKKILDLLSDFESISVREYSGKLILKKLGFDSTFVLDPTFLISSECYPVKSGKDKNKYICKYFLDEDEEKDNILKKIASYFNLPIRNNYLNRDFNIPIIRRIVNNKYPSVEKWLYNIKNAQFVVTDSYHGMIFSLIFKKQFIVVKNPKRGNARFESLLKLLFLENRLIKSASELNEELLNNRIDFQKIGSIIEKYRIDSLNYLYSELNK